MIFFAQAAPAVNFSELENQLKKAFPQAKFGVNTTIGDILSALFPYLFVLAGLILFLYLIIGGFELLTSAGSPKAVESAKGKITNAFIGFIIIFIAYWLVQILEIVLGITILG